MTMVSLRRAAVALLFAAAAVPVVAMATRVLGGTHLQYADYWLMSDRLLGEGGTPQLLEVFTLNNEHPVVAAQIIYLVNGRLFDGSNIVQGLLVVALGLAQVALLWTFARRAVPSARIYPAAVACVASAAVFAPRGSWSFLKSMSGAAWLPANVLMLIAIALLIRGRRGPAIAAGALATISYGTGFVAWPAYAVTSMAMRRSWRPPVESIVMFVVSVFWLQSRPSVSTEYLQESVVPWRDQVEAYFRLVGFGAPGSSTVWLVIGVVVVSVCLISIAVAVRNEPVAAAPFIGVAVFGLTTLALIARGRSVVLLFGGLSDRYQCLAALVWVATFALAYLAVRSTASPSLQRSATGVTAVLAVVVVVVALAGGQDAVDGIERGRPAQDRLEVALRFHVSDEASGYFGFGLLFPNGVSERLEAIGHYPFGSDSLDCGTADTAIDPPSGPSVGSTGGLSPNANIPLAVRATAVIDAGIDVDCVVAVDDAGVVVGAGYADGSRPDTWVVLARPEAVEVVALVDGQVRPLQASS